MIFDAYLTQTYILYRSQKENEKGLDLSSLASSAMRFPRAEILDSEPVGLTRSGPVGPTQTPGTVTKGTFCATFRIWQQSIPQASLGAAIRDIGA